MCKTMQQTYLNGCAEANARKKKSNDKIDNFICFASNAYGFMYALGVYASYFIFSSSLVVVFLRKKKKVCYFFLPRVYSSLFNCKRYLARFFPML